MVRVFGGSRAVMQIKLRVYRSLFVQVLRFFMVNMSITALKPILIPLQMRSPKNPDFRVKNNVIWRGGEGEGGEGVRSLRYTHCWAFYDSSN